MLAGCVQPAMAPNINSATARVLDAVGIQTVVAPKAGCCGAVKFHLNDQDGGKARCAPTSTPGGRMCDGNGGVEAIVMNASGCGVTVKEYGHILHDDPAYADKARRISALTRDLSELLPVIVAGLAGGPPRHCMRRIAAQCTHAGLSPALHPAARAKAQRGCGAAPGRRWALISAPPANEAHLCCGSAGTYSVLQPRAGLPTARPQAGPPGRAGAARSSCRPISAASPTCKVARSTPVQHWVEVLDAALTAA